MMMSKNNLNSLFYLSRDMPCKEKIRNIDDIPETCNEHLGCSQRRVIHQSSPNESAVGEGNYSYFVLMVSLFAKS